MKFLLLVTMLTAGATASRVRRQAGWQFGNLFQCPIGYPFPFTRYNYYACYCDFFRRDTQVEKRCCQTRDNCRDQIKKLEICKSLIDDPYRSFYSFSCSGDEVTCSEENNTCEDLICNCDRQAAICFSKENKGVQC